MLGRVRGKRKGRQARRRSPPRPPARENIVNGQVDQPGRHPVGAYLLVACGGGASPRIAARRAALMARISSRRRGLGESFYLCRFIYGIIEEFRQRSRSSDEPD